MRGIAEGRLACVDVGTAPGVIRAAVAEGGPMSVVSCETRLLNQGSRLTVWELMQDKIPVTLIPDSAAGPMMRAEKIDKVAVGADRITEDPVFNKIRAYTYSVLAKEHKIPFYVAAPISTFDSTLLERDVTIEERRPDELRRIRGGMLAPADAAVYIIRRTPSKNNPDPVKKAVSDAQPPIISQEVPEVMTDVIPIPISIIGIKKYPIITTRYFKPSTIIAPKSSNAGGSVSPLSIFSLLLLHTQAL